MQEKQKIIILILIILGIVLLIPLSMLIQETKAKRLFINLEEYYKNNEKALIYLGSSNCSYCIKFNPVIDKVAQDNELTFFYIDYNDLSDKHLQKIMKTFNIQEENFGTPFLIVTKNGEKVVDYSGYMEEEGLIEFLENNEIIKENKEINDETEEDNDNNTNVNNEKKAFFKEIGYTEYAKKIKSSSEVVIVLTISSCGACETAKPILEDIAKEEKIQINYINIDSLTTEERSKFNATIIEFGIDSLAVPYTMIIKNNEKKDSLIGVQSEKTFIDFFKNNNIIK